ncbi:MAG: hypothetical protein QM784_39805 [Polyangiaceae bacterium]
MSTAEVSTAEVSTAEVSTASASIIGLFVRDAATEDHTSKFFAYLTRTKDERRRWFAALVDALGQRRSSRRLGAKDQLALLDVAARKAGHSSLAHAWADYVGHLDLPVHGVLDAGGPCDVVRLLWQPDPIALRARLGCAVPLAPTNERAPRRQRR